MASLAEMHREKLRREADAAQQTDAAQRGGMPNDEDVPQEDAQWGAIAPTANLSGQSLAQKLGYKPSPETPQAKKQPNDKGSIADSLLQGLSLGWGDEGLSYGLAALAKLKGDAPEGASFDDVRSDMLQILRQQQQGFSGRNPKTAIGAEIGGGLLTGGTGLVRAGAALTKPTASLLTKGTVASGVGAAEGGVYGAGQAEEGERLEGAKAGAIAGAIAGPLAQYGISKLEDAIGNRALVRQLLKDGVIDNRTAGYLINPQREGVIGAIEGAAGQATGGRARPGALLESVSVGKDRAARNALNQGWNDSSVTLVNRANQATREKMQKMIETRQRLRFDPELRYSERSSDVLGDSIGDRFDHVLDVNKRAGSAIEAMAGRLKRERVNAEPIARDFMAALEGKGVKLLDDAGNVVSARSNAIPAKLEFSGSDFELEKKAIETLEKTFERLKGSDQMTAYDVHRMKKFLDGQIYEKNASVKSSVRNAERLTSELRHNLDAFLDGKFPFYDRANRVYSETIKPIKEARRLAGKNIDLESESGRKQLGVFMRRPTSNAVSAGQVRDMADNLDSIAKKYGGKFDDNVSQLAIFETELDNVLGTTAATSGEAIVKRGSKHAVEDIVGGKPTALGVAGRLKRLSEPTVNEDNLYQTMEDLLRRGR